jgi:serine/threonine protein kinase
MDHEYQLLERLGKGSFGQVFKASLTRDPTQLFAIKVLDMDTDEEAIADIRQEISLSPEGAGQIHPLGPIH